MAEGEDGGVELPRSDGLMELIDVVRRDERRQAEEDFLEKIERVWKPRFDAGMDRLERLEAKAPPHAHAVQIDDRIAWGLMVLAVMTSKQHACLQMVLAGMSLAEMSVRLGTSIGSIKSTLHLIKKLVERVTGEARGLRYPQNQMRRDLEPAFNAIADHLYVQNAHIPKNWVTACDGPSDITRHPFLYEKRERSPKNAPSPVMRRMRPPSSRGLVN